MTIKFTGAKQPAFTCAIPHGICSPQRARWSDGWWADVCTNHMAIWRKNVERLKAAVNPTWFLGKKKKETKP